MWLTLCRLFRITFSPSCVQEARNSVTKFDGVPQSLLIDRGGHLRGVFLGGGSKVIGTMQETVDKVVNEQ